MFGRHGNSPWQDAPMVREVGHAVKGRHGESASSPLKRGFQGLSIFKSLHNYHYGTFIIPAHSPTPNPERVQKPPQIVTDESPSHALDTTPLACEYNNFLARNQLAICLWQGFALLTHLAQNFWRGLSVPACFGWLAHWPIVISGRARICLRSLPYI